MKRKSVMIWLLVISITVLSCNVRAEENILDQEILQKAIDLVVENNPLIKSQRKLLEEIEDLPNPGKGPDFKVVLEGGVGSYVDEDDRKVWTAPTWGIGLEIPIFSYSRKKDKIMDRIAYTEKLEKAKQDYLQLKSSVVSELLSKIDKLCQLQNEVKNLEKLKVFFIRNMESLKREVKAGVAEVADLWELNERIIDTDTKIYNLSSQIQALKYEAAFNLGGEKWSELLKILSKIMEEA